MCSGGRSALLAAAQSAEPWFRAGARACRAVFAPFVAAFLGRIRDPCAVCGSCRDCHARHGARQRFWNSCRYRRVLLAPSRDCAGLKLERPSTVAETNLAPAAFLDDGGICRDFERAFVLELLGADLSFALLAFAGRRELLVSCRRVAARPQRRAGMRIPVRRVSY